MDGFPSGQREQTVNLPAPLSVVRIHPRPPSKSTANRGAFAYIAYKLRLLIIYLGFQLYNTKSAVYGKYNVKCAISVICAKIA